MADEEYKGEKAAVQPVNDWEEFYNTRAEEYLSSLQPESANEELERIANDPIRFTIADCVDKDHAAAFICKDPECKKLVVDPQMQKSCRSIYCAACISAKAQSNSKCPNC